METRKSTRWLAFLRSRLFRFIMWAFTIVFILGPLASLAIWSLAGKWFWPHALPSEWTLSYWVRGLTGDMLASLGLSVLIAVVVTIIGLIITVPIAYLIARNALPFTALFMLIFLLPQAFPQLPVFTNLLKSMYKWNLAGTVPGVVSVHLVVVSVLAVWTLVSVFRSISTAYEEASHSLGGSGLYTFFRVSLPMATPGIIAAGLLVFLYSLDEFTGTLLIGSPFITTAPVFMYNAAHGYELQIASVSAIALMVPGVALLLLTRRYMKAEYLAGFGR